MKRVKLEDRISISYVLLFLALLLFSNFILIYILKSQNAKSLEMSAIAMNILINGLFIQDLNSFSGRHLQVSYRVKG